MALAEREQQYTNDVIRLLRTMEEITGPEISNGDACTPLIAIMTELFARTHGEQGTMDFLNHVVKFQRKHPIIPASYTEEDRLKGAELSKTIQEWWARWNHRFTCARCQGEKHE